MTEPKNGNVGEGGDGTDRELPDELPEPDPAPEPEVEAELAEAEGEEE